MGNKLFKYCIHWPNMKWNTSWAERQRAQSFLATTKVIYLTPASGAVKYRGHNIDRLHWLLKNVLNCFSLQLFLCRSYVLWEIHHYSKVLDGGLGRIRAPVVCSVQLRPQTGPSYPAWAWPLCPTPARGHKSGGTIQKHVKEYTHTKTENHLDYIQ